MRRVAPASLGLGESAHAHPRPLRSSDANVSGAILSSARLGGAKISNADFSGVILRKVRRWQALTLA